MAKDTKTISVHPNNEVSAISFFQNFGWELFGNQEVKTSSSHLKESMWTGDIVQVTETSHYIKLTFQREKSMPNYSRLVQLENEYDSVISSGTPPKKPSKLIAGVVFAFVGYMLVFMTLNQGILGLLATLIIFVAPAVGLYIFRTRYYHRRLVEFESAEAAEIEQKRRILNECQNLL